MSNLEQLEAEWRAAAMAEDKDRAHLLAEWARAHGEDLVAQVARAREETADARRERDNFERALEPMIRLAVSRWDPANVATFLREAACGGVRAGLADAARIARDRAGLHQRKHERHIDPGPPWEALRHLADELESHATGDSAAAVAWVQELASKAAL